MKSNRFYNDNGCENNNCNSGRENIDPFPPSEYHYPSLPSSMKQFTVEKVYPQSIFEKTQCGEILVDEVIALMQHPIDGHSGRLALQTETDERLQKMMTADPSVICGERNIFKHNPDKAIDIPTGKLQCEPITAENYDILTGRIIPSFSWESKDHFLQNVVCSFFLIFCFRLS